MRAALIIAGGRSTRFGDRDKAVVELAGTPMIRRVADRVSTVVDEVVVNCRREQVPHIGETLAGLAPKPAYAEDTKPDRGPMAGIMSGLRAVEAEYAFVVACDMPFVRPSLVEYLFDRAEGHDAAVPRPDEWFQTTQAVYRASAMADACEAALERGERRIIEAIFGLDYVEIDGAELQRRASMDTFEGVNTREEFEAAAERFSSLEHRD